MTDNSIFSEIYIPIITPFTTESRVYEAGIENILEYLHNNGIKGIWLLGSYGGFPLLSEEERMLVSGVAIDKAQKKGMSVIVNVGAMYTDMAVRLASHAQEAGANAVASVVPFYYSSSHYQRKNFLEYFQRIIDSVSLPVFFYNNEKATGFKPDLEFLQQMLEIGIQGFKSKGDYLEMTEQIRLLKRHSRNCIYFSGSTGVHLQGHLLGADGVTSGVALALPALVSKLQNSLDNQDISEAIRLQDLVLKARAILGRYVGRAVACYDILQDKGIDVGTCRSPWLSMDTFQAREVIRDLKSIEEAI